MSQILKRRLIDQIGDAPTFVAGGSRLTGDLETPGPLVVLGAIRGDGRVGGQGEQSGLYPLQCALNREIKAIGSPATLGADGPGDPKPLDHVY